MGILYCILLNCMVLYYIQLYSIIFYSLLFYSIPFHSILFYSILFHSIILLYSIIFHHILLYSNIFYHILLYSIIFGFGQKKKDSKGHQKMKVNTPFSTMNFEHLQISMRASPLPKTNKNNKTKQLKFERMPK